MNKKKLIILISIIIALAILACVGLFALSGDKENKIADKLDMGEKYLEELEYEKALAVYKEVLKIDPKNVDAYLGMAEVYIAMGEYEEALDILEEGYEETESRKLEKKIEEVEALLTGDESPANDAETGSASDAQGNDAESGDDNLDPRFKACVVDGVYHNGYSLYDLTEEEHNLLASLIQYAEEERLDEILELLYSEQLLGLMEKRVQVQEQDGVKNGSIRIAFGEYKVYLETGYVGTVLVIIPLNDGTGYYFQRNKSKWNDNEEYCRIATLTCKNGMFNGEFTYEETSYILDTREVIYQMEMTGSMVNGLLDGKVYEYEEEMDIYFVVEYEAGTPQIFKEEIVDGEYRISYGYFVDESGATVTNVGRYTIYSEDDIKEELHKEKYFMPNWSGWGIEMPEGGIMYYQW